MIITVHTQKSDSGSKMKPLKLPLAIVGHLELSDTSNTGKCLIHHAFRPIFWNVWETLQEVEQQIAHVIRENQINAHRMAWTAKEMERDLQTIRDKARAEAEKCTVPGLKLKQSCRDCNRTIIYGTSDLCKKCEDISKVKPNE